MTLAWSDELGKRVRTGDWADQAISTTRKIREAVADGRWEPAAQLVGYFMDEAKVCHRIYSVWADGFDAWLAAEGVAAEELRAERGRVRRLLAFPDGGAFEPFARWDALEAAASAVESRLRGDRPSPEEALAAFDDLRESWRQLHDRWVDFISAQLALVDRRFGEDAIERCYRSILEPYLQERYAPFDLRERSWDETVFRNLYLSFEAMRGHLCGPDREGEIGFEEHDDRYVLSFDPCGSGNRGQRGDPVEGTPSRMEPPYAFGVTREKHDWAWNEQGVCHYCAHCCFALELWPAEQWGHPVRVVDSPLYPAETAGPEPRQCTWTIYKSIEAIPAEAYARIGRTKPAMEVGT